MLTTLLLEKLLKILPMHIPFKPRLHIKTHSFILLLTTLFNNWLYTVVDISVYRVQIRVLKNMRLLY